MKRERRGQTVTFPLTKLLGKMVQSSINCSHSTLPFYKSRPGTSITIRGIARQHVISVLPRLSNERVPVTVAHQRSGFVDMHVDV